ncbi:MAG: DUF1559 domain-containing protein [Planctomycetota bacterium]
MTRINPNRTRLAFTLIELLVVISIIALLIAILLPVLGAARVAARDVTCLSNLRQIGIATYGYETDNGVLPVGITSFTPDYEDWTLTLPDYYLGGSSSPGSSEAREEFLQCPTATAIVPGGPNHYSAHPRLFPNVLAADFATGANFTTISSDSVTRTSEVIMLADGALSLPTESGGPGNHDGGTEPLLFNIDSNRYFWQGLVLDPGDNLDDPVIDGPNVDGIAGFGHLRFRHGGDEVLNTVFVDGHAEAIGLGGLQIKNTRLERP